MRRGAVGGLSLASSMAGLVPTAGSLGVAARRARLTANSAYPSVIDSTYPDWPRFLFQRGERGAWYDPSDQSTLFQNAAGTTPVTQLGQPVGLVLDKSRGGLNALGAELVTNAADRQFTSDTGYWTKTGNTTIGGGIANINTTTFNQGLARGVVLDAGRMYEVRFTIVRVGAGSINVQGGGGSASFNTTGPKVCYIRSGASTFLYFWAAFGATDIDIDNISVREVPGTHLVQSTDAARPTVQARSNLLLATTTLATQNVTTLATPYTLSFTGTGTVTLSGTSTAGPLVGTGVGQRVSLTFTPTAGTLTLTVSGTVTDAQLELGSTATPYQRVTTATDYADIGLPRYLQFDGFDDFLVSAANLDMSATDEVTVSAGVFKGSDAARGSVVETGPNFAIAGGFGLLVADLAAPNYQFAIGGSTSNVDYTPAPFPAPNTSVLTLLADLAGAARATELFPRVNGNLLQVGGGNNVAAGGGNFSASLLYVGRRAGTSLPFNGRLHQLVIRGRLTTDGDLSQLEWFVAQRTGVTL